MKKKYIYTHLYIQKYSKRKKKDSKMKILKACIGKFALFYYNYNYYYKNYF